MARKMTRDERARVPSYPERRPVLDVAQAACRPVPEQMYPPDAMRGPERRAWVAAAKALCRACPLQSPCQAEALRNREPYGVWGGLAEDDREAIFGQREQVAS